MDWGAIVTQQEQQRRPNTARIYDYWLGGEHHFPEDAEHGERIKQVLPDIAEISLANRAYLRRAVRVLAEAGIDQFLDLGSGLPSQGNVHETARLVNSHARTVYVDIDVRHEALLYRVGVKGPCLRPVAAG